MKKYSSLYLQRLKITFNIREFWTKSEIMRNTKLNENSSIDAFITKREREREKCKSTNLSEIEISHLHLQYKFLEASPERKSER